jgi:hypothetical protein
LGGGSSSQTRLLTTRAAMPTRVRAGDHNREPHRQPRLPPNSTSKHKCNCGTGCSDVISHVAMAGWFAPKQALHVQLCMPTVSGCVLRFCFWARTVQVCLYDVRQINNSSIVNFGSGRGSRQLLLSHNIKARAQAAGLSSGGCSASYGVAHDPQFLSDALLNPVDPNLLAYIRPNLQVCLQGLAGMALNVCISCTVVGCVGYLCVCSVGDNVPLPWVLGDERMTVPPPSSPHRHRLIHTKTAPGRLSLLHARQFTY